MFFLNGLGNEPEVPVETVPSPGLNTVTMVDGGFPHAERVRNVPFPAGGSVTTAIPGKPIPVAQQPPDTSQPLATPAGTFKFGQPPNCPPCSNVCGGPGWWPSWAPKPASPLGWALTGAAGLLVLRAAVGR